MGESDTPANIEALKRQAAARRKALITAALAPDGRVDSEQLDQLEAIQKLVEMEEHSTGASRRRATRRTQITWVVIIALCIFSLMLIRLPSSRIELQARATHTRFALTDSASVAQVLPVQWVVSEGHGGAYLLRQGVGAESLPAPALRIEKAAAAPDSSAGLQLQIPTLPAGTQVELDSGFGDGSVAIALCGLEEPLVVSAKGALRISGAQARDIESSELTRVFISPWSSEKAASHGCQADHALKLRFLPASKSLNLQPDIAVHDLQLFAASRSEDAAEEPQSSLLSGSVQLTSVKGAPRKLEKNELLEPAGSSGRLRTLQLTPDAIDFEFTGRVSGLYGGSPYARESLMPRLLEWWLSQEIWLVGWSSGLTLLGIVLGLQRWFSSEAG